MGYYSKRHYERLSNGGPDTQARVAERLRRQAVGEQANREMMARFAPLSPEKMPEALRWQDVRIKELMR